jgi:WD40 repeat protein
MRRNKSNRSLQLLLFLLTACGSVGHAEAQELIKTFRETDRFVPVDFSGDDQYIAGFRENSPHFPGEPPQVRVWNLAADRALAHLALDANAVPRGVTFVPHSTSVVVFGVPLDGWTLWDFKSGAVRAVSAEAAEQSGRQRLSLSATTISPDGKLIACDQDAGADSFIRVLQLQNATPVAELKVGDEFVRQLVFSGDGTCLLGEGERYESRKRQYSIHLYKWDVAKGELVKQWGPFPMTGTRQRGRNPRDLGRHRMSPDGSILTTTLPGNGVLVIDVNSGQSTTIGPHPVVPIAEYMWGFGGRQLEQPEMVLVRQLQFSLSGHLLMVHGAKDTGRSESLAHIWQLTENSLQNGEAPSLRRDGQDR